MGLENCRTVQNLPTEAKYCFNKTALDIQDNEMKETAKLEVKIKNIS